MHTLYFVNMYLKNWQPSLIGYLILRAQRRSYDANEYEWKQRRKYTSSLLMKQL